jgi:hypothetical protein
LLLLVASFISWVRGSDYSDFPALPDLQKEKIVWDLFDKREFGKPEHKPICRELIASQGRFANANAVSFTCQALALAEAQGWKDLADVVQAVYEHPDSIYVHEESFRCLRSFAGKGVPPHIAADTQLLSKAGEWQSDVSEVELAAAKQRLVNEPDREAVLVYAVTVAGWHSGKGGNERGRAAAAQVINAIDRKMVLSTLRKLEGKDEVDWLIRFLGRHRTRRILASVSALVLIVLILSVLSAYRKRT